MIRRLAETPGIVIALAFFWKVSLLLWTAQPVPNNDAYFYDGAVVNYLVQGTYCNPTLIHALPISGGEVFSAYPPFYQVVLLAWMKFWGASALSAMWLHVALLGGWLVVFGLILQQLQLPARAGNLAGLFVFGITFHDRPDTVAHVLGILAVLAMLRGGRGHWLAAGALVLAMSTSLQIGGTYLLLWGLWTLGGVAGGGSKLPWGPGLTAGFALMGLVALVRFGFPHLWAGFQEHVSITPSLTEWRWPSLLDGLKALRTAPGVFGGAALLIWAVIQGRVELRTLLRSPVGRLAVVTTITALAIVTASLTKLSPNTVHIVNYLQPLAVAAWLGGRRQPATEWHLPLPFAVWWLALALVTSVRAIGMSTWGVACAQDIGYAEARDRLRAEVADLPAGSTVIASAAYLYDLASQTNLDLIHNDWPAPPGEPGWEARAFAQRRPAKIFLTQFDYYRRFGEAVEQLRTEPALTAMSVTNLATLRPPDAYPRMRRVVQHVSWAPVIVDLKWQEQRDQR